MLRMLQGSSPMSFRRRLNPILLMSALALAGTTSASAQPTFSKLFSPDTIGPGSSSTLTFTITNVAATPVIDLAFTDVLPAGVTIASAPGATTSCMDGVVTAPAAGGTITFVNGRLGVGQACTVSVNVTSGTVGIHTNLTGDLTSSQGNSGTATDDLMVVVSRPGFTKSFAPSTVSIGGRSTLTFTINNMANPGLTLIIGFTDNLPLGLEVANPANASTTCTGATLTATPGATVISLSSGLLAAGATCTATVDVTATGFGTLENVSSDLTVFAGSSGKATAVLTATVTQLSLIKSFTDDPVPPGGMVSLEFTITNMDRNFSATNVAFMDDLGATLTGLVALGLPLANPCGAGSNLSGTSVLSLTGGTIPPGGSCTFTVTLQVPGGAMPGAFTNSTTAVTGDIDGMMVTGNVASEDLFVSPAPLLTKTFLDAMTLMPNPVVGAGDDVVIRFTITNTSTTSTATMIAFTDELTTFLPFPVMAMLPSMPCGAGSTIALIIVPGTLDRQALSLTGGDLPISGMCSFDVTITIPVGFPTGTYVNTTDVITAFVDGATRIGNPASDSFDVVAAPRLTKEFTNDPVVPGNTVDLEFTLTHDANAPGDATGVTFTDNLATVLTGLVGTGLPLTDLCGPGNGTLTGSAGDTLLTFSGATLTPGQVCVFSVTLQVPMGASSGNFTNTTSSVNATVLGAAATENGASDTLIVAALSFTKQFTNDPALPGGTVDVMFTIQNLSPTDNATGILFSDDFNAALSGLAVDPASVPLNPCGAGSSILLLSADTLMFLIGGTVNAGGMCSFTLTLDVPAAAMDGVFANVTSPLTATVGGSGVVFGAAMDNLTIDSALLMLTKTFTDDPVTPGGTVTLEFTITNLDPAQTVTGITFTDDLDAALMGLVATALPPAGTACNGGTLSGAGVLTLTGGMLGGGASCTFSATLTVPMGVPVGTVATNTTSSVSGMIGALGVSGAPASDDLIIDFLTFTKSFNGPTTATGTPVLTFTVTNLSATSPVVDLSFSDDLNNVLAGLAVSGALPTDPCGAGSTLAGTSLLSLTGGNLPAGGMCSFPVNLLVPGAATPGTFPNTTSNLFQSGLPATAPATDNLMVLPPPTFAKSFAPSSIGVGLVSTLTFTVDNTGSTLMATAVAFTDNLPPGVVVATPPGTTNTCGGTPMATAGAGVISLSGGTVGASTTCVLQVNVTATMSGTFLNTTSALTSSAGTSGAATDTLTTNPPPVFSKSFTPNSIVFGGTSTLTLTLDNTSSTVDATSLDVTDNLPAGVTVATPANDMTTCTGGTLTAVPGSGVITYTGGSVTAGATCTITVDVVSTALGAHANTTGNLTSSLGNSGTASATLTVSSAVVNFLTLSKAFTTDPVIPGGNVTLEFTINNTSPMSDATDITFTDDLNAVLPGLSAVGLPANDVCGTGSQIAGTTLLTFTGGILTAGSSCTFIVNLQVPAGAMPGMFNNVTSVPQAMVGGSPVAGGPGSDGMDALNVVSMLSVPTLSSAGILLLCSILVLLAFWQLRRLS